MQCCFWFRSVFRVQGPWPKRYGYHLSIIILGINICTLKLVCVSRNTNLTLGRILFMRSNFIKKKDFSGYSFRNFTFSYLF